MLSFLLIPQSVICLEENLAYEGNQAKSMVHEYETYEEVCEMDENDAYNVKIEAQAACDEEEYVNADEDFEVRK